MLQRRVATTVIWSEIAQAQGGLISRGQLLELGLTHAQARTNVMNGRWQRILPGVYATFTGSVDAVQQVWAALLFAGSGAAACCTTALWLHRVLDEPPDVVHVSIPHSRRVVAPSGLRIHRRRALDRPRSPVHPLASPPRLRLEEALLDECGIRSESETVGLVLKAIQRRLTTAERVSRVLEQRAIQPRRELIRDVLTEAYSGVVSPLELTYRQRVEVAHGLPEGTRNQAEWTGGRWRYRDVEYGQWELIVELDGREAHPADEAFRDMRRDNDVIVAGRVTLRYGWRDVIGEPCVVAAEVGLALQRRGWPGAVGRCCAACLIPAMPGSD